MMAFMTLPLLDFGIITDLCYYTRKDRLRMAKLFLPYRYVQAFMQYVYHIAILKRECDFF